MHADSLPTELSRKLNYLSEANKDGLVQDLNPGPLGVARPCPPPGDLPNPGTELESPMSPALADRFFTTRATWEAQVSNGLAKWDGLQTGDD